MRPGSEQEVGEIIRGARGALALRGGGTRGPAVAWDVLDLTGLSGISLYEPGALTLVAGAGTKLAEVEAVLAAQGQCLPFEPPDLRGVLGRAGTATLGGVVSANASGPRRVRAGAARDFVIGMRMVDGRGEILRSGGRVMKNVTGLDLVKAMAGAHGTLGVISEVAIKVLPAPEAVASLCLHEQTAAQGVAAMAAALGSPYEVTGAAHDPARRETYLRIEGFAASVAYRLGRLTDLMGRRAEVSVVADPAALWRGVRDGSALLGAAGDLWCLSVQPSTAPGIVERLPQGCRCLLDWGGGRIWVLAPQGGDLRARLGPIVGHATLLRGPVHLPVFGPQSAGAMRLAAGLRAQFDPRGILNRGLMG